MNALENADHQKQNSPNITAYFESVKFGRNHWWHWLLGIFYIVLIYFLGATVLFVAGEYFNPFASATGTQPSVVVYEFTILTTLLASFLFIILAVFAVQKLWHRRAIKDILTSAERFRWGYLARAMMATSVVTLLVVGVQYLIAPSNFTSVQWASDPALYLLGLAICITLVPFQAASEELFFRGYLNQALIRYTPSPWTAYLISSIGFALIHALNSEAENQLLPYLTVIFIMGFGMSTLTHMEGGLESAMGFHIANNLFCFCLIGYELPDLPETSLAYLTGPLQITWATVGVELLSITCVVLATTLWHRHAAKSKEVA